MRVTRKSRVRIRIDNILFVALFLGAVSLLAWLSTRYHLQADWTASGRNTLSVASQRLLERLEGPLRISAYARKDEMLRNRVRELVDRYRRHKPDMELEFVNPDTVPDRVRELGISTDGEILITYQGRTEHLRTHSEQAMTNVLQQVARSGERWLVFINGHGERDPLGNANHDLGVWGKQLEQRGFNVQTLNLLEAREIPDNTSVLAIAGPQVDLMEGEVEIIRKYLEQGGNLLWLTDPGESVGMGPIAETLGLEFHPGAIVDPTTQILGVDPSVALVTSYPPHAVTRDFQVATLFPRAMGILTDDREGWDHQPILSTSASTWAETGELAGNIRFEEETDIPGPLDIGIAMIRVPDGNLAERPEAGGGGRTQRVLVIGDGDFLSNAFLGNQGNLDLGMNIVNWLASDDALIAIPAKTAPDTTLDLSPSAYYLIGFGFLLGMPLLLLGAGLGIWWRRRRR